AIKVLLVAGTDTTIVDDEDRFTMQIADLLERAGKDVVLIYKRLAVIEGFYAEGASLIQVRGGTKMQIISLDGVGSLRGQHNAQNALAAVAACLKVGLKVEEIQAEIGRAHV